jgi:hypothetical protein
MTETEILLMAASPEAKPQSEGEGLLPFPVAIFPAVHREELAAFSVYETQSSGPPDDQGKSIARNPSPTVNVCPHFGHLILVSLLTMLLFAAQPAKLNITANANTAFFRFFISPPPFLFENVDFSDPGAIPHVPRGRVRCRGKNAR